MRHMKKGNQSGKRPDSGQELPFKPRIINTRRMAHVVLFSGEEQIRETRDLIGENLPWITIHNLFDPVSVTNFTAKSPTVFLMDDTSLPFVDTEKIKAANRDAVIVLLSSIDLIQSSPPSVAQRAYPHTAKADLIFAVNQGDLIPHRIIPSVIRAAEDLINIKKYSRARRFIVLVVDDEPRWYSQFLPVLYNIIGQRADVMLTRTYEETLLFLFGADEEGRIEEEGYHLTGHGDDVICLITDVFFPKGDEPRSGAGVDLLNLVHRYYPRIPSIIASKAKEAADLKQVAFVLPKGDPGSIQKLRDYIYDYTGMGDFLIHNRKGRILHRIRHIEELYNVMLSAEKDSRDAGELRETLEAYGQKDFFSTWLYMHGFRELADRLRPKRDKGRKMVQVLKRSLHNEIKKTPLSPLVIGDKKITNLTELHAVLKTAAPAEIQQYSNADVFSNWLDRNCYPEIAEEIRPIHGTGEKLRTTLVSVLEKWIEDYQAKKTRNGLKKGNS
jgi:hypothetical protein